MAQESCGGGHVFSVIVPVYNVASYLQTTLDSLLAQQCSDWECICIDDGSTDECPKILDDYAKRDGRFVVRHQVNAGVSAARNAALDMARGDWIMFLDADDVYEPSLLSSLESVTRDNPDADAVGFGVVEYYPKKGVLVEMGAPCAPCVMSGDAILAMPKLPHAKFAWNAVNKVYRAKSIADQKLRFEVGMTIGEDTTFAHLFLAGAKKVVLRPDLQGYRYVVRSDSALHSLRTELIKDPLRQFRVLHDYWHRHPSPGLLSALSFQAAAVPFLGCEFIYDKCVRGKTIEWLLASDEFKLLVLRFLIVYGTSRQRLFSVLYLCSPKPLKRWLLVRLSK